MVSYQMLEKLKISPLCLSCSMERSHPHFLRQGFFSGPKLHHKPTSSTKVEVFWKYQRLDGEFSKIDKLNPTLTNTYAPLNPGAHS